jgi:thiamine-phosphate pyrophosphorylase
MSLSEDEDGLTERLRLMVLTHPHPACGRSLADVVAECCDAGATAIELRDKGATAEELLRHADTLVPIVHERDALLIVNDRMDVALAAGADGVHLGADDLPLVGARRIAPPGFLLGYSTDDPDEARTAAHAGADYLGVGAVAGGGSDRPGARPSRAGRGRPSGGRHRGNHRRQCRRRGPLGSRRGSPRRRDGGG